MSRRMVCASSVISDPPYVIDTRQPAAAFGCLRAIEENSNKERFNGSQRSEVLNADWFTSIKQAQVVIETWLKQYNHIRPHHVHNVLREGLGPLPGLQPQRIINAEKRIFSPH